MPDHIISRRSNSFVGDRLYVNSFTTSSTAFNLFVSGTSNFVGNSTVTGSLVVTSGSILAASAGNVLIGTTTDAGFKLDVNGTARIQGNITTTGEFIGPNSFTAGGSFGIRASGFCFGDGVIAGGANGQYRAPAGNNIDSVYVIGSSNAGQIRVTDNGRFEPTFNGGFLFADNVGEFLRVIGEVTWNEGGRNLDFRIEGDTNANLFFLDASADNIGIGTNTPNAKLDVNGSTIISGSLTVVTGSGVELQVTNTGVKIGNAVTDTHTVTGSLSVSGSTAITGSLSTSGSITGQSLVLTNQNQLDNFNSSWDNYIAGSVNIGRTTSIGGGAGARLSISCDTGTNSTAFNVLSSGINSVFYVSNGGVFGNNVISYNGPWNLAFVGSKITAESAAYPNELVIIGQTGPVRINPSGINYTSQPVIIGNGASTGHKFQVNGTSNFVGNSTVTGSLVVASGSILAASAGNVLVGTTTDAGFKLDVNGVARFSNTTIVPTAGNVAAFTIRDSSNAQSLRFFQTSGTTLYVDGTAGYDYRINGAPVFSVGSSNISFGGGYRLNFPATSSAPTLGATVEGWMYYDTTLKKFRGRLGDAGFIFGDAHFSEGPSVFNESGNDYDTRIEGDTDQNLFFADASTDRIGIGKSTPNAKLDVNGSAIVSGSATLTDVLVLPYNDPLPSGKPTGSIALSGSGATFVGMFVYNGTSWVTV